MTNEEIIGRITDSMSKCCLLSECFTKEIDTFTCSEALVYLVEGIACDLGEIREALEEAQKAATGTEA
jgi:hypothetical protein